MRNRVICPSACLQSTLRGGNRHECSLFYFYIYECGMHAGSVPTGPAWFIIMHGSRLLECWCICCRYGRYHVGLGKQRVEELLAHTCSIILATTCDAWNRKAREALSIDLYIAARDAWRKYAGVTDSIHSSVLRVHAEERENENKYMCRCLFLVDPTSMLRHCRIPGWRDLFWALIHTTAVSLWRIFIYFVYIWKNICTEMLQGSKSQRKRKKQKLWKIVSPQT